MSSCDSVSPTTFGAGAEHSEGVTFSPHYGSSQHPGTGRPSQQLAGNRPKNRVTWVVRLSFRVAAGITFQLPRGRADGPHSKLSGRARLCLVVAVARLDRSWCFWWLLFLRWCFSLARNTRGEQERAPTQSPAVIWRSLDSIQGLATETDSGRARGLASRKECGPVSRRSCMVQNFLGDGAAIPCQVVAA